MHSLYDSLMKCPNDCTGNGLCFNGKCACNVGFRGPDCSEIVCADETKVGPQCTLPRCPNDCDAKGLCMNGKSDVGRVGLAVIVPFQLTASRHATMFVKLTRSQKSACTALGSVRL